jgi:cell division protein ZapA
MAVCALRRGGEVTKARRNMAHVSVTINGRQYRMACDDGQETHLTGLAHELDQRIERLRAEFGEIGDMRLTVMAALTLSDELADARERAQRFEHEVAVLQQAGQAATEHAHATQTAIVAAFNSAAERIETVARRLGEPPGRSVAAE